MQDTSALTVSVMGELQDSVRKTFILNRGVYNQPTVEVQPAVLPAVLKYDEAAYPKNRIGLAKWTTDKRTH